MNSPLRATDGIVLDSREHGESDLIVTLFCRDSGRITAIAKGARKSLRRFVNKLELFSFLRVNLRQRNANSLALLEEADLHAGFIQLRQELKRYTAASVIREFTLLATREGEADERLYSLLLWALHHLDLGSPHLQVVLLFLLKFYDYVGYRPELAHCVHCAASTNSGRRFGFGTIAGGVVCEHCGNGHGRSGIGLANTTIELLHCSQDLPLARLHQLSIPEQSLYEGLNVLHRYGRHVFGRDIISWSMLRTTLQMQRPSWDVQR